MRILLVEDDDRVVAALTSALRRANLVVDRAATAADALPLVAAADLVLLDMGLPDRDGLALCAHIRRLSDVPIIAVTARRDEAMVVAALRAGVDDYVTKPYRLAELMARMQAVLRRSNRAGNRESGDATEHAGLRVCLDDHQAWVDGQLLNLAPKELHLLALLVAHAGGVVTRTEIMETIWQTTWVGSSRTVDVHVANLRAKLGRPELIETVRGAGYRLADPETS